MENKKYFYFLVQALPPRPANLGWWKNKHSGGHESTRGAYSSGLINIVGHNKILTDKILISKGSNIK